MFADCAPDVEECSNIVTQQLPDIAAAGIPENPGPLEWVGMHGIDVPLVIEESAYRREHHARVGAEVSLPRPDIRGIHMSRLHLLVDELGDKLALTPARIGQLLAAMIDSHADCGSDRARATFEFDLLVRRGALETAGIGGWRSYPVSIVAIGGGSSVSLRAEVQVEYSSTCPCSASLSRQLIEREFLSAFADRGEISVSDVAVWLNEHATLATPHGQRSEARIGVDIADDVGDFGLLDLIDRVETALATPVQTAVKRADEQAFAARSGQNLMFVEDAARRIRQALVGDYRGIDVRVDHRESLHPHDAVASAGA